MSALRSHTFWFFNAITRPDGTQITSETILEQIGDFGYRLRGKTPINHFPALFPARAAQAFSATESSIMVRRDEIIEEVDDVMRNGYTFTDGVGTISIELAEEVWTTLLKARHINHRPTLPSAFQIRLCGFKGVLTVDFRLDGRKIKFRKSMKKFQVFEWEKMDKEWPLEIAKAFDRPMRMHLNRWAIHCNG